MNEEKAYRTVQCTVHYLTVQTSSDSLKGAKILNLMFCTISSNVMAAIEDRRSGFNVRVLVLD
jgi:hypothetical protein